MAQTQRTRTSASPIVFEVEVQPTIEPIEGKVRAAGHELEFTGWVGLATAMENILEGRGEHDPQAE